MTTSIIKAIINLVEGPITPISGGYIGGNRANNMGKGLEEYVKDLFSGTLLEKDEAKRMIVHQKKFCYLGNQNNPPDVIIKNGDAIEIKKTELLKASLALNSSYPKSKLFSNSPMITKACRMCEDWTEKDIIYAIGNVDKNNDLKVLSFVYGVDYAASADIYERIKNSIKQGILETNNVEFAETKELGRVNKVDPLGITNLRIRGMWQIENPIKVFRYIYKPNINHTFNFMGIINYEKYKSFNNKDVIELEKLANSKKSLFIRDVRIKDPNNPAILKNAKLISFYVE